MTDDRKIQSSNVQIGPLTKKLLSEARWKTHNQFPAHQSFADEFEQALSFLSEEQVIDNFIHRLSIGERGVWAEVWAAYYLHINGFRITQWEPKYVNSNPGDFEVELDSSGFVFVEVKRPTWQSELNEAEYNVKREEGPKNISGEGRAFNNIYPVLYSINKALPKCKEGKPNIVFIVDDLFVSALEGPLVIVQNLLAQLRKELLEKDEFDIISGVFLLHSFSNSDCVEYYAAYVKGRGANLPQPVEAFFEKINEKIGANRDNLGLRMGK